MLTNVERRNLRGTARLLRAELVAREEQEAEAACFVLVPERDEPGHLPNVSQASDVDDEDYLACEDVERDVLARVGAGAQIRETRHAPEEPTTNTARSGGKNGSRENWPTHTGYFACLTHLLYLQAWPHA